VASSVEKFQLSVAAAEAYEAGFVPALFADWAPAIVDAAGVRPGQTVLDVACGTGVVAREAADPLQGQGHVIGLDLNEAMLVVARRLRPDIEWIQGDAAALPFDDEAFDVVLCQAALMFFPDPALALREMARVAKPGGTVAVQVWASRESQTGFKPFYDVVTRHAGPDAVDLISAYWRLGDLDQLAGLFEAAGLEISSTRTRTGAIKAPSIDMYVTTEIESTPLIERISDAVYERIRADAGVALRPLYDATAGFRMPIVGHVLTASRGR
jgi:ubiquinone/menaquinone biosynthesis C-methylase UbiE